MTKMTSLGNTKNMNKSLKKLKIFFYAFRHQLFQKIDELIVKHNKLFDEGKQTYKMDHNKFSDMTDDEKAKYLGALSQDEKNN